MFAGIFMLCFSGSGSRVWVQVLEVVAKGAMIHKFASFNLAYMFKELIEIIFKENHAEVFCSSFVHAHP